MLENVNKQKTVIVGLSGGVDSSVAAALLKDQGYRVIGVFMHYWSLADDHTNNLAAQETCTDNKCCNPSARQDAARIAARLGIQFQTYDVRAYFKEKIVDYYIDSYRRGLTPNPCVLCNEFIKFSMLLEKGAELGADFVATGHYAQVRQENGAYRLFRGIDARKDQSYFLYRLHQPLLEKILLPVGGYVKPDVRAIAEAKGLVTARKRDSQELCFMTVDREVFLKTYIPEYLKAGDIVDTEGNVLGQHRGLQLYTYGQRRGVDVGGTGPWYVCDFDWEQNKLIVTNNPADERLRTRQIWLANTTWITGRDPQTPMQVEAQVRYGSRTVPATLEQVDGAWLVRFAEPQRAIAPGQSLVAYVGGEVIGGGMMSHAKPADKLLPAPTLTARPALPKAVISTTLEAPVVHTHVA